MADTVKRNEELVLDDSVKVNSKGEAILGVLEGPCADVINPTRNDRQYDEELWETVFKDPIVSEYFDCGGILGELDHPTDRTETDTSKVAICMPERPKKGKDGKLYARFDILDTPNGRIAYTLAKYGYKLGVSSRGNGDVYEAYDGKEHVDAKSYELKAFDLVLLPAVKAARLKLKESVGNKSFKQAIQESLTKADESARKIMLESLERLKIDYKIKQAVKPVETNNKLTEAVAPQTVVTADDTGVELVKELQSQIKRNKELTESLQRVQEQLSVCYAKETKYEETIDKLKTSSTSLSESADRIKSLESQVATLTEQLNNKDAQLKAARERFVKLTESRREDRKASINLNESLSSKDTEISRLTEALESEKKQSAKLQESLETRIEEMKKNSVIKTNEYNSKIVKATKLVEEYKKVAKVAVSRYIESKALNLGVSASDIKSRLTENYSFEDIDRVCEDLQLYQLKLSKLPITIKKDTKIKVTESVEPIKPKSWVDDEVDESLRRLAGL